MSAPPYKDRDFRNLIAVHWADDDERAVPFQALGSELWVDGIKILDDLTQDTGWEIRIQPRGFRVFAHRNGKVEMVLQRTTDQLYAHRRQRGIAKLIRWYRNRSD